MCAGSNPAFAIGEITQLARVMILQVAGSIPVFIKVEVAQLDRATDSKSVDRLTHCDVSLSKPGIS